MGYLMTGKEEACATSDLVADPRFPALRGKDTTIRSMLAVPLKVGDRFTGMLAVTSSKPGRKWTDDEIKLLTIVGMNSAVVIEKAQLKFKAKELDDDLRTAKVIQQSLLPSEPLRIGCWEGVGRVLAAQHVGGDAFDYFMLDRSRAAIVIGDVSGKSTPAAMLMSHVQAKVKARCDGRTPIPEAMAIVNEEMLRSAPRYVTMFVGELDASRKLLRYTNAGHNYPLVRRPDGTLEDLNQGGFPIGMFAGAKYEQGECVFGPGIPCSSTATASPIRRMFTVSAMAKRRSETCGRRKAVAAPRNRSSVFLPRSKRTEAVRGRAMT
jgi:sigma-B regulation protein RsbU (phosphoserine phosphatase)